MAVPYHTHTFEIPQASKDDVFAGVSTELAVVPAALGTAATKNIEDFATASQGQNADNAVQPNDLATVATSGSYTDLTNRPTLGTAAAQDSTAFATALQGGRADTAVQPADLGSAAYQNTTAFATAAQGTKADSAVQPTLTISAGTGLSGGGTLAANRTLALSSTSIASLALADSAVQPARQVIAGAGLSGGGTLAADRTVALNAASIASLAKADTAIQALGGATGQVLTKNSSTDGDVAWQTVEGATAVSYAPQTLTSPQQTQARNNIGAQATIGYTPVNRSGDTLTGRLVSPSNLAVTGASGTSTALQMYPLGVSDSRRGEVYAELATTTNIVLRASNAPLSQDAFFAFRSNGSAAIPGALSKGSGTFLIDHPLDPLNKNLRHGFVEGPEYVNIYRGEVRLVNGRAAVNIDEYFEMTIGTFWSLNTDITVSSLQNQEGFARVRPLAKMTSGHLEIVCEDDDCNDLIAWAVTGRRKDAFVLYMDGNCESITGRFIPEFNKPDYSEADNG